MNSLLDFCGTSNGDIAGFLFVQKIPESFALSSVMDRVIRNPTRPKRWLSPVRSRKQIVLDLELVQS